MHWKHPPVPWGDITQALIYHQVRKYLLRLDERKRHPKFWRPSILLVVPRPDPEALALVDFANNLKKGGVFIIGSVLLCDKDDADAAAAMAPRVLKIRLRWLDLIKQMKVKAFSEVAIAPTVRQGVLALSLVSGIGFMKPNTFAITLPPAPALDTGRKKAAAAAAADDDGGGDDDERSGRAETRTVREESDASLNGGGDVAVPMRRHASSGVARSEALTTMRKAAAVNKHVQQSTEDAKTPFFACQMMGRTPLSY